MKNFIKILLLSSLIITTFISGVRAEQSYSEDKYMVIINHSYKEDSPELKNYIDGIAKKISTLVANNKNTYKNQEQIKKMEANYRENDEFIKYGNYPFAYPISTIGDTTILFTYLTPDLVNKVKAFKEVTAVEQDKEITISDGEYIGQPHPMNDNKKKPQPSSATTAVPTTTLINQTSSIASPSPSSKPADVVSAGSPRYNTFIGNIFKRVLY